MDYSLIRTPSEGEFCCSQAFDERTFDKSVNMRKNLRKTLIRKHLFISKACIAPDGLSCLLFDSTCQFGKSLNLIEWISARECHVCELIILDDIKQFLN